MAKTKSSIQPKKHFSQNFLVDPHAQQKVLDAMKKVCDMVDLPVIEIGPGQGDITKRAVLWGKDYTAIEIDKEAVDFLTTEISTLNFPNFHLIHADVTDMIRDNLLPTDFSLISSLPYHIGSRLLVDLAISHPHINFGVIHQKEVTQKTQKLKSNFTFFGAWLNLFWNCRQCFEIPKSCFIPQPKVVSAFLEGTSLNSQKEIWLSDKIKRENTKNILKKLFSFPNKTLVNNLKALDWNTEEIQYFVQSYCNNNLNIRLDWSNYRNILQKVASHNKLKNDK